MRFRCAQMSSSSTPVVPNPPTYCRCVLNPFYLRSKIPPYPLPLKPPRTDFVSLDKTKHSSAEVLIPATLRVGVGVVLRRRHSFVRQNKYFLQSPDSKMASKICTSGVQKPHLAQTEMAQMYLLGTSDELECSDVFSLDACQSKCVSDVLR